MDYRIEISNCYFFGGAQPVRITSNLKKNSSVNIENSTFIHASKHPIITVDGFNDAQISLSGNTFIKLPGSGPLIRNGNGQHENIHFSNNLVSDGKEVLETSVNSSSIMVDLDDLSDTKVFAENNQIQADIFEFPKSFQHKVEKYRDGSGFMINPEEVQAFLMQKQGS